MPALLLNVALVLVVSFNAVIAPIAQSFSSSPGSASPSVLQQQTREFVRAINLGGPALSGANMKLAGIAIWRVGGGVSPTPTATPTETATPTAEQT